MESVTPDWMSRIRFIGTRRRWRWLRAITRKPESRIGFTMPMERSLESLRAKRHHWKTGFGTPIPGRWTLFIQARPQAHLRFPAFWATEARNYRSFLTTRLARPPR